MNLRYKAPPWSFSSLNNFQADLTPSSSHQSMERDYLVSRGRYPWVPVQVIISRAPMSWSFPNSPTCSPGISHQRDSAYSRNGPATYPPASSYGANSISRTASRPPWPRLPKRAQEKLPVLNLVTSLDTIAMKSFIVRKTGGFLGSSGKKEPAFFPARAVDRELRDSASPQGTAI